MKRSRDVASLESDGASSLGGRKSRVFSSATSISASPSPRPVKPVIEDSNFCKSCQAIDFRKLFATKLDPNARGHRGIAVTAHRTDFDSGCSLCNFVLSFDLPEFRQEGDADIRKDGYHLRAFDSLKVLKLPRTAQRTASDPSTVIAVVPGTLEQADKAQSHRLWNSSISKGLITPLESLASTGESAFTFHGRVVSPDRIDFSLLRSWIQNCESSKPTIHRHCLPASEKPFSDIKVIDCSTRDIVPLPAGCAYVALSYVWGDAGNFGNHINPEASTQSVPRSAPTTVEDAMKAVTKLGERYLWVDRYCIDSDEEKHLQIQNMHLIYEGASFTIANVSGVNSNSGLPGLSLARCEQPTVETATGTLVSTLRHVAHHIGRSKWVTRGWTYQEAFLSRRCLFFTNDQVYFACKSFLRCESISQAENSLLESTSEALAPHIMKLELMTDFKISHSSHSTLADHVAEYTSRSLSYADDALNAFKGMLARQKYCSFWGIPTEDRRCYYLDDSFAQQLLWSRGTLTPNKKPTTRRKSFPTWSWASLDCQIDLAPFSVPPGHSRVKVCVTDSSGHTMRIGAFEDKSKHNGLLLPEITPLLELNAVVNNFRFVMDDGLKAYPSEYEWHEFQNAKHFKQEVRIDFPDDEQIKERLLTETWPALALAQRGAGWLIFQWVGDIAQRVGVIYSLRHPHTRNIRRTIILG